MTHGPDDVTYVLGGNTFHESAKTVGLVTISIANGL